VLAATADGHVSQTSDTQPDATLTAAIAAHVDVDVTHTDETQPDATPTTALAAVDDDDAIQTDDTQPDPTLTTTIAAPGDERQLMSDGEVTPLIAGGAPLVAHTIEPYDFAAYGDFFRQARLPAPVDDDSDASTLVMAPVDNDSDDQTVAAMIDDANDNAPLIDVGFLGSQALTVHVRMHTHIYIYTPTWRISV
jgi:hypothetical protein